MERIFTRNNIVGLINRVDCRCGIELGTAVGNFSEHILQHSNIPLLYSVDKWDGEREHGIVEYYETIRKLHHYADRSIVLRVTFKEAFDLFPDNFFDFIYIDGFAFTGNRNEIFSWWPTLKKGGIYSGHDYCTEYPLVKEAVDEFVKQNNIKEISFTEEPRSSWIIIK